jgi:uncharacterized protein (TIGR03085 family)
MGRHDRQQAEASPVAAERAALCDLLTDVGEHAPTLCGEWDAGDLAAHLVVRESRPDAAVGLAIPALRGYTAGLERATRKTVPFADLVERVRTGPPLWSPLRLPGVEERVNLHEYFIHHEDVRRAAPGWRARDLSPALSAGLWNVVRLMAPFLIGGMKDTRVTLRTPDGAERSIGRITAEHQVMVTGPAGELLLYLSGRRPVAEVQTSGSSAAQARLAAARLGM